MSKLLAARIAAITSEQMESAITDLASECDISELLAIPGVWEAIAEHFNNDAIARVLEESDDEQSGEPDEPIPVVPEEECTTIDGSNVAQVPSYNGWIASWEYPGFVAWHNDAHPDALIAATPDYHELGVISVEASTLEGKNHGGCDVAWPVEGRTFVGYVVAMAPILDTVARKGRI